METNNITAVIVDDEFRSRRFLNNLLKNYCKAVDVVGQAEDIKSAIALIDNTKPQLLFLDIKLKEGDTFEILKRIKHQDYYIIFVTAFNEFAIKAFKFSAIDYLLKPVNLDELKAAIEKYKQHVLRYRNIDMPNTMVNQLLSFNQYDPTITIATETSIEFVKIFEILRLESDGSYTTFYLSDGSSLLSSKNLKTYEDILSEYNFFRAHQSHLVNLKAVIRLIKIDGTALELTDGSQIPLSRRKKEAFITLKNSN